MTVPAISFFSAICISFLMFISITTYALADWEFQDSGVTENLNDVCFVDELNGWAVGNNSTIIATDDGGKTWVVQECHRDSLNIKKVFFVSKTAGYCIGDIREGHLNRHSTILKTTDGGNIWKVLKTDIELADVYDLTFADENTGWVTAGLGGLILYTDDGGITWSLQFRFDDYDWPLNALHFSGICHFDKNICYALAIGNLDSFSPTDVYKTTDGGLNWKLFSRIESTRSQLSVVSSTHFWAYTGNMSITVDGGILWETIYEPIYENTMELCPIDEENVFAVNRKTTENISIIRYSQKGSNVSLLQNSRTICIISIYLTTNYRLF